MHKEGEEEEEEEEEEEFLHPQQRQWSTIIRPES
jgi:hypothetical protein